MANKRPRQGVAEIEGVSFNGEQTSIYMDHNATTPLDPRVLDAMKPYLTNVFGNPASRNHSYGHAADRAVEVARAQTAKLIHAADIEIIWTSGATESNNLAIKGVAHALRSRGRHIITQATEHHAVLDPCRWLADEGFDVTVLPVNAVGRVDPVRVAQALRTDTILVSMMWANNEIGTVQPIREIGNACRERDVLFHTDATQAVGTISVDLAAEPVDLLSLSAHKFYGPKGSGALYVRSKSPRIKLVPLLHGGGHERGMRSGTINVPAVVGMGAACELRYREMTEDATTLADLRDQLEQGICSRLSGVRVNGDPLHRLPQTTHLSFDNVDAEGMLIALNDVAVSTGSACTSASVEPSHVLTALGLSETAIYGSIRFGLGRGTTVDQVHYVIRRVVETAERLRGLRQLA